MEEGTVVKWHVSEGDLIEQGQIIFEIETDKATFEVEADHAGRLARIVVQELETVPVRTPVAYLAESAEEVDVYLAAQEKESATEAALGAQPDAPVETSTATEPSAPPRVEGRVKASPAAKKLASDRGVDLRTVVGTGPGGRITTKDVENASGQGGPAIVQRRLSSMRRTIARNLQTSKQTIPHFYVNQTIDAGPMQEFYRARKAQFDCSLNDVIVKATAATLREFPAFRSRIEEDHIAEYQDVNIGLAVGSEEGLVVPVVLNADRLTFEELAAETRRVVEVARTGTIENMGKGIFTITNLGMFGTESFSAIINPPEAAILAVGAIREDAVVSDGVVRAGKVMTVTLSCDHRVVDGIAAARFLKRFKELLETPDQLDT
jgi:pyruvate dehydrogenase E2 component (dihydrolipoamide acetyltransferase)